ncbi:8729_t:CDS:2, partial [Scutellospora calospora]
MPPLPCILDKYIIKTNEKINKNNTKKCPNFVAETTPEERKEVFKLCEVSTKENNETISSTSYSSTSNIIRSSFFGPIDNYIVRTLSSQDMKKFHQLILWLTVSCGWALHWVNKPEATELFEFLNPFLKLPDRHLLGERILNETTRESDKATFAMLRKVNLSFLHYIDVRYLETSRTGTDRKLKREIYEIISSANFWTNIHYVFDILKPYCIILNKLQSDKARLHQPEKALRMSKLHADITYNHRKQPDLAIDQMHTYNDIFEQQSTDIDPVEQTNIEISTLVSENKLSFSEDVEIEESSENVEMEEIDEFSDEEFDNELTDDEENFDTFLQEWLNMLEEERLRFEEEYMEGEYVDEDEFSINNIVHPAIDANAKWELATLFKELEL